MSRRIHPRPHPGGGGGGATTLTNASFVNERGYLVPDFSIGSTSSTFFYGRLTRKNNRYYVAAPGYFQGWNGAAYMLDTGGTPPGTGSLLTWPFLTNSGAVSGFGSSAPPGDTGFDHFHACVELPSGNLLAAIVTDYATQTNQINGPVLSQNTSPTRTDYTSVARQVYGGHLGWVPDAILPYVGNRTAYMAGLGSKSGQGWSRGPSLCLFDPTNPTDTLIVFYHPNLNQPGDPTVQQRPNTISGNTFNSDPGYYWNVDHVDVALLTDYGMAFIVLFGEGDPDYPLQNYMLATGVGVYFGCIPLPTIIAAIQAAPATTPGTVHVPSWELWAGKVGSFQQANTPYNLPPGPRGGWYDTVTKQVHMFNQFSWFSGSQPEGSISIYDLVPTS